jgi:predicted transcriptional regulator
MSSEPKPQPSPKPRPDTAPAGDTARAEDTVPAGDTARTEDTARAEDTVPAGDAARAGGTVPAGDPGPAAARDDEDAVALTDAKAMRALAHPLRMALLELFAVRETLTATQASEALGESPANCAFHLRTLAKYGFLREAGGGRGRERPWALANRNMMVATRQLDPQSTLAAGELSRLWLERWIERARRAHGTRYALPAWDDASGWFSSHVFLTAEETSRLRGEMRRLLKPYEARLADPALRPAGALPVEWTVFAAPSPELAEPGEDPGNPEGSTRQ